MDNLCPSLTFIGLIIVVFMYFQKSQELARMQQDQRIKAWCDWMSTLDGYDGSFAICRNEEEKKWAEQVWNMQYVATIEGLGTVFTQFSLDFPFDVPKEKISRALSHIEQSRKEDGSTHN